MTKTTCYKTTDGELFEEKAMAEQHEIILAITEILKTQFPNWEDSSPEEVARVIAIHFTVYTK